MDSNQNLEHAADGIVAPAPTSQGRDVVFQDKPKKNNGMILGMVVLAILAVGGIGFGVWAMMDGNTQKEQLNSQISTLKSQNSELQERIDKQNESLEPELQDSDIDEKEESNNNSSVSEYPHGLNFIIIGAVFLSFLLYSSQMPRTV